MQHQKRLTVTDHAAIANHGKPRAQIYNALILANAMHEMLAREGRNLKP